MNRTSWPHQKYVKICILSKFRILPLPCVHDICQSNKGIKIMLISLTEWNWSEVLCKRWYYHFRNHSWPQKSHFGPFEPFGGLIAPPYSHSGPGKSVPSLTHTQTHSSDLPFRSLDFSDFSNLSTSIPVNHCHPFLSISNHFIHSHKFWYIFMHNHKNYWLYDMVHLASRSVTEWPDQPTNAFRLREVLEMLPHLKKV